jgi:hypothetical protein
MNLRDLHTWSTARYLTVGLPASQNCPSFAGSAAAHGNRGKLPHQKRVLRLCGLGPILRRQERERQSAGAPLVESLEPSSLDGVALPPRILRPLYRTTRGTYRRYSVYFCQPPLAVAVWRGRALGRDQEMQLSHFLAILSSSQRLMVRLGQAFRRPRFKLFWVR